MLLPVSGLFSFPDYYITLRDAIYAQELNVDGVAPLYREAVAQAQASLRGHELSIMLSRCEYLMGR
ncbi:MAG: hypothetical protein LBU00_02620, partial [Treponema sp.]|nr:hypothetical protein [Treponema sp.]